MLDRTFTPAEANSALGEVRPAAERLVRLQRPLLEHEALFGATPERREVQVVHRAEVVVHERRTHVRDRGDAP